MATESDIRALKRSHSEASLERESERAAFFVYAKSTEARLNTLEASDREQVATLAKIEAQTTKSTKFLDDPTKRLLVSGLVSIVSTLVTALTTYLATR